MVLLTSVVPTSLSRRTFAASLLFALPAVGARAAPCPPPAVLFVCPVGTVKSAIAREVLRARAAEAGLKVQVQSRGLHPENHVSPGLAVNLKADGIDPAAEPVRELQASDVSQADIVIAFDEAAAAPLLRRARVWDVPSWNSSYAEAKAALATQMDALMAELLARSRDCAGDPAP